MSSERDQFDDSFGSEDDNDIYDEEMVPVNVLCLFCDEVFNSYTAFFQHSASHHEFDFENFCKQSRFTYFDFIKFINFVRSSVSNKWQVNCLKILSQYFTCRKLIPSQSYPYQIIYGRMRNT